MSKLRIIAVEKSYAYSSNEIEPCIACAYTDNKLHVYDTWGELYYQREYFENFDSLVYLIGKGKYEWSDFYIEKGDLIARDSLKNILVSGECIGNPIITLAKQDNNISSTTIKLYYQFLCELYKDNSTMLKQLASSYNAGEFREDILAIIEDNPIGEITTDDCELIVRSRVEGYDFISKKFKSIIASKDPYKLDQVTYYFTRLFKLQYENYISFLRI